MTQSDESQLWIEFKEEGDQEARDRLIIQHMRVVKYIAGRMAIHVPSTVDMDDLVGWGVLGLMDAVEKFNHRQNVKFSTYASIRIRGAIIDEIRSLDWAPRSLRSMARKVGAAKDKLRHAQGREPSLEDIGEEIGSSPEQVEDVMMQLQTAQVLSLDDYLPSDLSSEARKIDVLPDEDAKTASDVMLGEERIEALVQAILELPDQQQKVLNLYYYEELTLKEIGAVLGVSESRICQVNSTAMKRLRKAMQGDV